MMVCVDPTIDGHTLYRFGHAKVYSMQILLQNFLRPAHRLVIDLELPKDESDVQNGVRGQCSQLGDRFVGLFATRRRLFLWIDGDTIEVDHSVTTSHRADVNTCVFSVHTAGKAYDARYDKPLPVSTPFYSEDDEDADFGLWVHNVLNSDERKRIFFNSWSDKRAVE
jgi:hypothetical protein